MIVCPAWLNALWRSGNAGDGKSKQGEMKLRHSEQDTEIAISNFVSRAEDTDYETVNYSYFEENVPRGYIAM